MKITKRTQKVVVGFILALSLFVSINSISNISVFTATSADSFVSNEMSKKEKMEIKEYETVVNSFVEPVFGDRIISSCEYIYNLDDSADYIYVEFENGGYAIYAKQTMEILEYSLQDYLPYTDSGASKYYAGPTNYFLKNNSNQFFDILTGDTIEILETEIDSLANQIRESIQNENATEYVASILNLLDEEITNKIYKNNSSINASSKPDIDTGSLIAASTTSGRLIPNYKYFTSNPTIGNNFEGGSYGNGNSGTCGPIAAQLLLGYNNYFNDRRIIEDKFLNGYDDSYDSVTNPESNPNRCTDPMSMTRWTTGTRSEDTGTNSFYSEIITRIMEPNTSGSTIQEVKNGIDDYLSDRLSSSGYSVDYEENGWWFGYSPIDSSIIKEELDAGRPIIISMDSNLGGSNHFVVGYGYQDYTYADGSGTYEGYVVHFGWPGIAKTCVWVNSAWCDGYVSLKINHIHNYNTIGSISGTSRTEYKCTICGHRTDAAVNMSTSERYVERVATLPNINGNTYQDYYVTFKTAGNKLFQTFGSGDAKLYLYDSEYNQLAYNDDSGYSRNSLLSYTVKANTPYILRTQFYISSTAGTIKIGITAADTSYSSYENIQKSGTYSALSHLSLNTTKVLTYTPTTSGTYRFDLNSTYDNFLYVIDPRSSSAIVSNVDYNDDGGTGLNAQLTRTLDANVTYFIICSKYNPSTDFSSSDSSVIALTVSINSQTISSPSYLQLSLVSRSGFAIYNWEVKISNPNSYAVQVTYNSKMCFESDAKNYTNLSDLVTITIPANSSVIVTINGNGTAGWITTCIDYRYDSYNQRRVTCANGLSGNLTMNTPVNKIIDYTIAS